VTLGASQPQKPLTPETESGASHFGGCANCGAELFGPFCAQCGEKRIDRADYSIKAVAQDVVQELSPVDSKILRTLTTLLTKPGLLSQHYFAHGRSRYTKPLTLFIALNVAFFFIQPHTGLLQYSYTQFTNAAYPGGAARHALVVARLGGNVDEKTYESRFNLQLQQQKKSMLIFCVPVLALAMVVLYAGHHRYYAEHLVFSIHVYAFLLIFMGILLNVGFAILILLLRNAGQMGHRMMLMAETETTLIVIIFVGLTAYIAFGLRRAYGDRPLPALLRGMALSISVLFLIRLYRDALFYITLWTT
jgi:hypothetical protein